MSIGALGNQRGSLRNKNCYDTSQAFKATAIIKEKQRWSIRKQLIACLNYGWSAGISTAEFVGPQTLIWFNGMFSEDNNE